MTHLLCFHSFSGFLVFEHSSLYLVDIKLLGGRNLCLSGWGPGCKPAGSIRQEARSSLRALADVWGFAGLNTFGTWCQGTRSAGRCHQVKSVFTKWKHIHKYQFFNNPVMDTLLSLMTNCMDRLALLFPTPSGVPSSTEAVQVAMTFSTCPWSCEVGCNSNFTTCTLTRLGLVIELNLGREIWHEASILLVRKMPEVSGCVRTQQRPIYPTLPMLWKATQ